MIYKEIRNLVITCKSLLNVTATCRRTDIWMIPKSNETSNVCSLQHHDVEVRADFCHHPPCGTLKQRPEEHQDLQRLRLHRPHLLHRQSSHPGELRDPQRLQQHLPQHLQRPQLLLRQSDHQGERPGLRLRQRHRRLRPSGHRGEHRGRPRRPQPQHQYRRPASWSRASSRDWPWAQSPSRSLCLDPCLHSPSSWASSSSSC